MAKSFTVPKPVVVKNQQGLAYNEPAIKFETYLEMAVFDNPKLDNPKGYRWSSKILNLVTQNTDPKNGAGTTPIVLSDEDWTLLSNYLENPAHTSFDQMGQKQAVEGVKGYLPHVCRQLMVFVDAVADAVTVE